MGEEQNYYWSSVPPPMGTERQEEWRHFDNSVNAVSFGFVATAILISMFLVMAICERFLRHSSSSVITTTPAASSVSDIESPPPVLFHYPSPKVLSPIFKILCNLSLNTTTLV